MEDEETKEEEKTDIDGEITEPLDETFMMDDDDEYDPDKDH